MPLVYEAIAKHYVPGRNGRVSDGRSSRSTYREEHLSAPLATVQLQPAMFRSLFDTPPMPLAPPPQWQVQLAKRLQYWLADWVMDRAMAGEVNAFRGQFGLAPVRRFLKE